MLNTVGRTSDGKTVLAGVYRFYETEGLPLDALFEVLQGKNAIPCWVSLYREAITAGMKHDRVLARLDPAISDVFGSELRDRVLSRLRTLHDKGVL